MKTKLRSKKNRCLPSKLFSDFTYNICALIYLLPTCPSGNFHDKLLAMFAAEDLIESRL